MMGKIIGFPRRHRDRPAERLRGTVHVYRLPEGGYEIGHESASGNSWGHFAQFSSPVAAIEAAHRLNREHLDGECDVHLARHVCLDLNKEREVQF